MKNLMHCLCALLLGCAVLLSAPVQAATPQKKAVRTTQAKKVVRTTQAKKASTTKKVAVRSGGSQCRVLKLKGGKTRRLCKAAPADRVLNSPIQGNALSKTAPDEKTPEVKVRSAPDRAYAVDGEVFFFQGRKYRVAGLEGAGNSDMAKQRLQKALESGTLAIDPQSADDAGVLTATVRVNGHNLVESLR